MPTLKLIDYKSIIKIVVNYSADRIHYLFTNQNIQLITLFILASIHSAAHIQLSTRSISVSKCLKACECERGAIPHGTCSLGQEIEVSDSKKADFFLPCYRDTLYYTLRLAIGVL